MNRPNVHRLVATVRGFTLIEVLISVLIMAIGLLGLGAVIPVVVREQRIAADATAGVAVGRLAREVISERLTNAPAQASISNPNIRYRVSPLDAWIDDAQWSPEHLWHPWTNRSNTTRTVMIHPEPPATAGIGALREEREYEYAFDNDTGEFFWQHAVTRARYDGTNWDADGAAGVQRALTVRDRLWPGTAILGTGDKSHRPQFVWDFIARRVDTGVPVTRQRIGSPAEIEIAVFVRRIDMNIRLPSNRTLFDVLTDPTLPAGERRLPVAVDSNGVPTGNGTNGSGGLPTQDAYAIPLMLLAEFDDHIDPERRGIRLRGSGPQVATSIRLAAQPGQRLVDNLGHIYTVREARSVTPSSAEIIVDPPVPAWLPPGNVPNRPTLRQVAFTPQIPAAVSVFRLSRPVIQP